MGYVIAIIVVVLLVTGFAAVLVMNAARKRETADASDPGADPNPLGIIGSDEGSPLGDTREHAGEQNQEGETVGGQDADRHGGSGAPRGARGAQAAREPEAADIGRPVVGGEAEGERQLD